MDRGGMPTPRCKPGELTQICTLVGVGDAQQVTIGVSWDHRTSNFKGPCSSWGGRGLFSILYRLPPERQRSFFYSLASSPTMINLIPGGNRGHSISPLVKNFLNRIYFYWLRYLPGDWAHLTIGFFQGSASFSHFGELKAWSLRLSDIRRGNSCTGVHHSLSRLLSSERGPGLSRPELFHPNVVMNGLSRRTTDFSGGNRGRGNSGRS